MSEEKAQNVYERGAVAQRLRFLRGSMSQAEFAKKVGVSRSAVANYETGRTIPSEDLLVQIAKAFEISPEFLVSGGAKDVAEIATALGFGPNRTDTLTEDEWAVVRLLRVRNTEVIKKVVDAILDGIEKDEAAMGLFDPMTIEKDLMSLYKVKGEPDLYLRGMSRGNLEKVIEELARRLNGTK